MPIPSGELYEQRLTLVAVLQVGNYLPEVGQRQGLKYVVLPLGVVGDVAEWRQSYLLSLVIDSISSFLSSLTYIQNYNHLQYLLLQRNYATRGALPLKKLLYRSQAQYQNKNYTVMQLKENLNPNKQQSNRKHLKETLDPQQPLCTSLLCPAHSLEVGRLFCEDCLRYDICSRCLQNHKNHKIHRFKDFQEAKQMTKEVLLIQIELTLNRLKGRENEMKNQVEEISLIKQKLKSQANQILNSLKDQFDLLQRKIQEKLESEFQRYEKELDCFYRQYNAVNDYLRENLLEIIDGQINIAHFGRDNVFKDIDCSLMPQFGKMKQAMEKSKKYMRTVKDAVKDLETSIKFFTVEEQKSQCKYEKYDKFLKQKTCEESDYNSSLLRTLNLLENSKPDLCLLRAKLRN